MSVISILLYIILKIYKTLIISLMIFMIISIVQGNFDTVKAITKQYNNNVYGITSWLKPWAYKAFSNSGK